MKRFFLFIHLTSHSIKKGGTGLKNPYAFVITNASPSMRAVKGSSASNGKDGNACPEYNKRMLKGRFPQVKEILSSFSYPYNRRIAGQHGHFTMEDYTNWLKKTERDNLARALRRLAQLNQSKVYLFWSA